ncbi:MAG: hypothetical protein VX294_09110 [Candidatus Latescibacterota bacterium]|nr:hypothetical protein [Candidatus Latescibacterota bacterium]
MSKEQKEESKIRRIEDIFIIISIFSLWPVILDWQGILYQAILYGALIGLLIIFVRRVRRFKQARTEMENDQDV